VTQAAVFHGDDVVITAQPNYLVGFDVRSALSHCACGPRSNTLPAAAVKQRAVHNIHTNTD